VSKISEEALSILRGELQIICLYFLHKIAHLKINNSNYNINNSSGGSNYNNNNNNTINNKTTNQTNTSNKNNNNNNNKTINSNIKNNNIKNNSNNNNIFYEEEEILNSFAQHLKIYHEAIVVSMSKNATSVVLSPLSFFVPTVLMKSLVFLLQSIVNNNNNDYEHLLNSNSNSNNNNNNNNKEKKVFFYGENKTRVLKIVVAIQQIITNFFQFSNMTHDSKRKCIDFLIDNFEILKKFVALLHVSVNDLQVFIYFIFCLFFCLFFKLVFN
jgi:hypothetical protein